MRDLTRDEMLESMIDGSSLASVLEGLREVCYAKAQHLEENWQDGMMAHEWERAAKMIHGTIRVLPKMEMIDR